MRNIPNPKAGRKAPLIVGQATTAPASVGHAASEPAQGAHSARRALTLLKLVGTHHGEGVRLTDLIRRTGYDKSTVHRLLGALAEEGFVERIPATKLYRLGVESIQLGILAADMAPLVERFRPLVQRIARLSQDTTFLVVRSGDEVVYVHREVGAYPVRVFVAETGKRRLIGFSAAGIGMLAQEDSDAAIAALHARHAGTYTQQGMTLATLRELVQFARTHGYSEMRDFGPPDTAGVGCAFAISPSLRAGVGIAAIRSRMSARRMRELGRLLQDELAPYRAPT